MKKGNRILSHDEFVEVEKSRRSVKTENFALFIRDGSLDKARIGISVSKKNGNAVRRNKIKRQIRAMVDGFVDMGEKIDLVVIARRSYDPSRFHDNAEELSRALTKLGVKN